MGNYQEQLDSLVTMAKHPGFKHYAWQRAKELEADPSGLWAGITQDLIGRVRNTESGHQIIGKPRLVGAKSNFF